MTKSQLLLAQNAVIVAGVAMTRAYNQTKFNAINKRSDGLNASINHRFDNLTDWIHSEGR